MTASQIFGGAVPAATFEHFVDGDTAATFLGITRRTLLQKVRDGKIPGHALDPWAGKKDWRFLLSELHAYMLSCESGHLEHANHQGGFDAQVSSRQSPQDNARGGSRRGCFAITPHARMGNESNARRHRSCQRYRSQPGDASREVDRQKLRETINQLQPFEGKPRTFGQLCQDYIENELRIDQSESARPKAFPTVETYERHLIKRIIPRWGKLAPLAVESRDVEGWFRELRKGNAQKKVKPLADPTIDKIRRIMSLVFKHGQRCNFLPRQQEGNPMNWVSQRTTSDYRAIVMTPKQAFEVLLNIPEPRRTLTLSDAATALRVSELLGLMWMDLDFHGLVIYVRRAYVWGRFKEPKSKASKAPVPMHPLLAGFLLAWHERTTFAKDSDLVFPSIKLKGKKPLVSVRHGTEIFPTGSREGGSDHGRGRYVLAFTTFDMRSLRHW